MTNSLKIQNNMENSYNPCMTRNYKTDKLVLTRYHRNND